MLGKLETALDDIDEDRLRTVAIKLNVDSTGTKEAIAKAIADKVDDEFNNIFEVF